MVATCLAGTGRAMAQQSLAVTANLKISGGNFDQSGVQLENQTTGEKHKVEGAAKLRFNLKFNSTYILAFTKPGYITKKVQIDTRVPSNRAAQGFYPIHFNVILMEQYEGVNIVVFNQPVSKWQYNRVMDDFFYDTDYTKSIQSAIKDAEDELAKKKEELARQAEEERKNAEQARKDSLANARAEQKALKDSLAKARKDSLETAREEKELQAKMAEEERARTAAEAAEAKKQEAAMRMEEEERSRAAAAEAEAQKRRQAEALESEAQARNKAEAEAAEAERRKAAEAVAANAERRRQAATMEQSEEERRRQAKLKAVEQQRELLKASMSAGSQERKAEEGYDGGQAPVHFEEIEEKNRRITKATVKHGDKSVVYMKIVYDWGGIYYFRDDRSISESMYKMATERK